ncbi:MAG: LysM peptidoglycan-binding domain-containing protein [Deltaproteobacteria bacterium]|nr:LysM peptidoglycan-binding domain-containing protein [Deltaproteobacteria bacterium]
MEWKDRERQAEDEDATGRIDVEAPGYSVLREGAGGFSVAGILRRPLIPVAILAAVVLLVGVWRMGGEPSPTYGEQLARLESRIAQLEQRLETMAPSAPTEADTDAEGLQRQIDALMRRLDRTETALSQRVAALESKAKFAAAAPRPRPRPRARATAKASIYTVKPGDTLYSIGRRENLSVEKLCQLNNLKAGDPIRPGDRLKVSP